ncbi:hypothetical protein BX666DRAFT_636402 [Dichotomocladium elegans]|nr:hypothetical protein BX666DRAFT_636402 [Dichotomocladium elegans]
MDYCLSAVLFHSCPLCLRYCILIHSICMLCMIIQDCLDRPYKTFFGVTLFFLVLLFLIHIYIYVCVCVCMYACACVETLAVKKRSTLRCK